MKENRTERAKMEREATKVDLKGEE